MFFPKSYCNVPYSASNRSCLTLQHNHCISLFNKVQTLTFQAHQFVHPSTGIKKIIIKLLKGRLYLYKCSLIRSISSWVNILGSVNPSFIGVIASAMLPCVAPTSTKYLNNPDKYDFALLKRFAENRESWRWHSFRISLICLISVHWQILYRNAIFKQLLQVYATQIQYPLRFLLHQMTG